MNDRIHVVDEVERYGELDSFSAYPTDFDMLVKIVIHHQPHQISGQYEQEKWWRKFSYKYGIVVHPWSSVLFTTQAELNE